MGQCLIAGALLFLFSCGNRQRHQTYSGAGDTLRLRYSTLLTIVRYDDYTKVDVADPWHKGELLHTYILTRNATAAHLPEGTVVKVPLQRAAVFTGPHCKLLEYLGASDKIAGVTDRQYIVIPEIQQRLKAGKIEDFGSSLSPEVEKIVDAHCDALIVSPFENTDSYGRLSKTNIPIIEAADYMEPSPLARAEWMKFFGLLFGRSQQADSLFEAVEQNYLKLKQQAAALPLGKSVLTERKTGATWYTPGGRSTIATIIRDAHGGYAFASDNHTGSLPLSAEQIIDKAGDCDVWAFKVDGQKLLSREDLLSEYFGYRQLKAFREGEIYECLSSQVPFFEESAFHPDYLLREMMLLLHPGKINGTLRYYTKLNEKGK